MATTVDQGAQLKSYVNAARFWYFPRVMCKEFAKNNNINLKFLRKIGTHSYEDEDLYNNAGYIFAWSYDNEYYKYIGWQSNQNSEKFSDTFYYSSTSTNLGITLQSINNLLLTGPVYKVGNYISSNAPSTKYFKKPIFQHIFEDKNEDDNEFKYNYSQHFENLTIDKIQILSILHNVPLKRVDDNRNVFYDIDYEMNNTLQKAIIQINELDKQIFNIHDNNVLVPLGNRTSKDGKIIAMAYSYKGENLTYDLYPQIPFECYKNRIHIYSNDSNITIPEQKIVFYGSTFETINGDDLESFNDIFTQEYYKNLKIAGYYINIDGDKKIINNKYNLNEYLPVAKKGEDVVSYNYEIIDLEEYLTSTSYEGGCIDVFPLILEEDEYIQLENNFNKIIKINFYNIIKEDEEFSQYFLREPEINENFNNPVSINISIPFSFNVLEDIEPNTIPSNWNLALSQINTIKRLGFLCGNYHFNGQNDICFDDNGIFNSQNFTKDLMKLCDCSDINAKIPYSKVPNEITLLPNFRKDSDSITSKIIIHPSYKGYNENSSETFTIYECKNFYCFDSEFNDKIYSSSNSYIQLPFEKKPSEYLTEMRLFRTWSFLGYYDYNPETQTYSEDPITTPEGNLSIDYLNSIENLVIAVPKYLAVDTAEPKDDDIELLPGIRAVKVGPYRKDDEHPRVENYYKLIGSSRIDNLTTQNIDMINNNGVTVASLRYLQDEGAIALIFNEDIYTYYDNLEEE